MVASPETWRILLRYRWSSALGAPGGALSSSGTDGLQKGSGGQSDASFDRQVLLA